jgi:hypothetical protein
VSGDQHGSPIPGSDRPDILTFGRWLGGLIAMEQTTELIEIKVRRQQIPATEIDDRLMPGFALVVATGLNHAHVFMLDPGLAARGSDDPQEHGDPTAKADPAKISLFAAIRNEFLKKLMEKLSLRFRPKSRAGHVFSITYAARNRKNVKHGLVTLA